jgi:hypothetical protein
MTFSTLSAKSGHSGLGTALSRESGSFILSGVCSPRLNCQKIRRHGRFDLTLHWRELKPPASSGLSY